MVWSGKFVGFSRRASQKLMPPTFKSFAPAPSETLFRCSRLTGSNSIGKWCGNYGQVIRKRNDRGGRVQRKAGSGPAWRWDERRTSEDARRLNTSYVKRLNLTVRTGARLTSGVGSSVTLGRRSGWKIIWSCCDAITTSYGLIVPCGSDGK